MKPSLIWCAFWRFGAWFAREYLHSQVIIEKFKKQDGFSLYFSHFWVCFSHFCSLFTRVTVVPPVFPGVSSLWHEGLRGVKPFNWSCHTAEILTFGELWAAPRGQDIDESGRVSFVSILTCFKQGLWTPESTAVNPHTVLWETKGSILMFYNLLHVSNSM